MSWRVLLALIACNAVWATNPVMGKILMQDYAPLQVSWMRYASALAAALIALAVFRMRAPGRLSPLKAVLEWRYLKWILCMGVATFFGSAYFQYQGLSLSTSTENSIIVAMEPLFAVLLARIFLGEHLLWRQFAAVILAFTGFFFLSKLRGADLIDIVAMAGTGNFLLLLAMPLDAAYSIISRKLAGKVKPLSIFVTALIFGFLVLSVYLDQVHDLDIPTRLPSGLGWVAIFWIGPLGTTLTYVYWTVALVHAPVAAVSITLFIQPILGSAFGALFLGDRMNLWQVLGGALILSALLLQTSSEMKKGKKS